MNSNAESAPTVVERAIFTQTVIAAVLAHTAHTQMNALDALKTQPAYTRLVPVPMQTQYLMSPPELVFIAQSKAKGKYHSVNVIAGQVVRVFVLFTFFIAGYMTFISPNCLLIQTI